MNKNTYFDYLLYEPEIRGAAKILSRHRLAWPREMHSSRDDFFQKLSKSHNYYFISWDEQDRYDIYICHRQIWILGKIGYFLGASIDFNFD